MWWEAQSAEYFEMLVDIFKSVIVYELNQQPLTGGKVRASCSNGFYSLNSFNPLIINLLQKLFFSYSMIQILDALSSLNKINFSNPKKPKIPAECFYIEDLCNYFDIAKDYINWLSDQEVSISSTLHH